MSNTLLSEIGQNSPFESIHQETALSVLRTADTVHRYYSNVLLPFDITFQQYNVLRIVRGAGKSGVPTSQIGERMIEQNPGLTRLIDRLERKKLLKRKRSKSDRRVVTCTITKTGSELLTTMQEPVKNAEKKMLTGLKKAELQTTIELLSCLRQGIEDNA